jgi:NDP-sugar pyrophosphorylase family protein
MDKPVLVIMAAGMGSRYGGLKQIDPVDEQGNKIIDFSIYDAIRAGFKKVIFIIKKENERDFRTCIGDVVKGHIEVEYVFQELSDIPEGAVIPEGRIKPWGTAHAVLSCRKVIEGPFAVINADDFYGREAFRVIYDYLANNRDDDKYRYAMVGYELRNTLTENGYVSRGVCSTDADGYLTDIVERTHIEKDGEGAKFTEDDGATYTAIDPESIVSMNMWGFTKGFIDETDKSFRRFFSETVPGNPLKAECYLPGVVDELLKADKATVKVLKSTDRWFGVTYKEDKPFVMESIKALKEKGEYPESLW